MIDRALGLLLYLTPRWLQRRIVAWISEALDDLELGEHR